MASGGGARWVVRFGALAVAVALGMAACGGSRVTSVESRTFFPIEVPTSLPTNEVVGSREELGKLLKIYGIPSANSGLENLDFTDHAVIFSVDASVAEVRREPGRDIILLQPEPGRGVYVAVVRGDVSRLGKFTWK